MLVVVILAFTRKKLHESSSDGRTDEVSIKETKEAQRNEKIEMVYRLYRVHIQLTSLMRLVLLLAIPFVLFLANSSSSLRMLSSSHTDNVFVISILLGLDIAL